MRPDEQAAAARRRRGRILVAIGIVGFALLAVAISRSLGDLRKGRAHETELNRQISESEGRIEMLEDRVEQLRDDPAALETLAREELLMAEPTEVVVLLHEDDPESRGPRMAPGSADR